MNNNSLEEFSLGTDRLLVEEFKESDLADLFQIMRKDEVMYAWENGFSLEETGFSFERKFAGMEK